MCSLMNYLDSMARGIKKNHEYMNVVFVYSWQKFTKQHITLNSKRQGISRLKTSAKCKL